MLEFINFEILGYLLLLFILVFFLIKDFRAKRNTVNEKTSINPEQNNLREKIPEPIKKMMELIKILPKRENELHNDYNAKLISEKLNKNFKLDNDVDETTYIEDDVLEEIGNFLDDRFGPTLAPLVRRIEQDGSIVLDMEAIKFVTGEHIPLVTPSGAIRVMNFLSIEQDLEISILTNKPFFYRSNKTNKIEKLSSAQLSNLILTDEQVNYSQIISEHKNNILTLTEDNDRQFYLIEKQKDTLLFLEKENEKLKNQLELLLTMNMGGVNTSKDRTENIEEKKLTIDGSINSTVEEKIIINNETKIEENKIEPIIQNQQIENVNSIIGTEVDSISQEDIAKSVGGSDKRESIIQVNENIKNENNNNEISNKKLKILSVKNSKETIEKLYSSTGILSNKYILNSNTSVDKLVYVSSIFNEFTKEFTLSFIEKNLVKEIKIFLEKEGFLFNDESLELIYSSRSHIKRVAYFTDQIDKIMLSTNLIQLKFKEDEMFGMMLSGKRYSEVFSKEEISAKLDNEQRDAYKKMLRRRLKDIENGDYNVI